MKKLILILTLAIAMLVTGCAAGNPDESTPAQTTEATTETTTEGTTEATQAETTAATETTAAQDTEPEQTEAADDYLADLEARSDALKASLHEEELTQSDMNRIAQELYVLWDDALNDLWGKLQDAMSDEDFDKLLDEQLQWIDDKEAAVTEAGKEVEGGSMYPLVTNSKAADITEDRVYELYDLLKQQ